MDEARLSLVFGNQALTELENRKLIESEIERLHRESEELLEQAQRSFHVDLSLPDIIVATMAGVALKFAFVMEIDSKSTNFVSSHFSFR